MVNQAAISAQSVRDALRLVRNSERAENSQKFFKTDPGQYGEGDVFVGVTVPQQRQVAKKYSSLPLGEVEKLLQSKIHEERLTALIILVNMYTRAAGPEQQEIYDFYLAHTDWINNWDLVDSSAPYIVGAHLLARDRSALTTLAHSAGLWERRIAILATAWFIRKGESHDTFVIANILLLDEHDLIHKAVGWMLREVGKSCGQEVEEEFLRQHYKAMPRTMLRYAIERFDEPLRQRYLKGEV